MRLYPAWLLAASTLLLHGQSSEWHTAGSLVAWATLAGPGSAVPPAVEAGASHYDPIRESLAFSGAEIGFSAHRGAGTGRLEVTAIVHVHRHPGEPVETELEEACAKWTAGGLSARAGVFFAPLGATNVRHAHGWHFVNAPLLYGRFLGESGLRNPGVQVGWAEDGLAWSVAVQRATGDSAESFRSGHGGEVYLGRLHAASNGSGPLVTLRGERAHAPAAGHSVRAGASVATAQNGSGSSARTWLAAVDLDWRRERADASGWDAVQLELVARSYQAAAGVNDSAVPVAAETIADAAVALSLISAFGPDWTAALRLERALPLGRADYESAARDPLREARTRLSPALAWEASTGLLLRLQYDHDRSPAFGRDDAVWLVAQWQIGGH